MVQFVSILHLRIGLQGRGDLVTSIDSGLDGWNFDEKCGGNFVILPELKQFKKLLFF